MNFSLLFYQDISRMAPRMFDKFKVSSLTTREQAFVPDLDVVGRFHKAGISYAISYDDHIDFYMNGSRGVDFNLGGTMPFVASLVMPKLLQHDLDTQLLVAEARLEAMQTAVEAYKADNDEYPEYPEQLLHPLAYISEVPIDPFSPDGEKMIYDVNQSQGTYVIYSIGPDGEDDLGLKKYDMSQGLRSEGDLVYTNKSDEDVGLVEF
jgi:hypothetical protein